MDLPIPNEACFYSELRLKQRPVPNITVVNNILHFFDLPGANFALWAPFFLGALVVAPASCCTALTCRILCLLGFPPGAVPDIEKLEDIMLRWELCRELSITVFFKEAFGA